MNASPLGRSNLRTRVLTAVVLLPIPLLLFLFAPPTAVAFGLLLCLTLSVLEMAAMVIPAFEWRLVEGETSAAAPTPKETGLRRTPGQRVGLPFSAVALGWILFLLATAHSGEVVVGAITLVAMAALLIGAFSSRRVDVGASRAFGILVAVTYGSLPWLVIWRLYEGAPHARYLMILMAVAWAGDTGGYFGGRFLGGKIFKGAKLAPTISPKKTWEGALCGLLGSAVGALLVEFIFRRWDGSRLSEVTVLAMAFFGGCFGQLGDLVESTFKRFSGVKDSGGIFPGHGGFLDRVDAILFAAPVIWVILHFLGPGF